MKSENRVKGYKKGTEDWEAEYNMFLDDGLTCNDCAHCERCCSLFGQGPHVNEGKCQFYPNRFLAKNGRVQINKDRRLQKMKEKQEAREICLKIWGYLRDHPEIEKKEGLPQELYNLIEGLRGRCSLCELYKQSDCSGCPLFAAGEWCISRGSAFHRWLYSAPGSDGNDKRRECAGRICDIVEAWEV